MSCQRKLCKLLMKSLIGLSTWNMRREGDLYLKLAKHLKLCHNHNNLNILLACQKMAFAEIFNKNMAQSDLNEIKTPVKCTAYLKDQI